MVLQVQAVQVELQELVAQQEQVELRVLQVLAGLQVLQELVVQQEHQVLRVQQEQVVLQELVGLMGVCLQRLTTLLKVLKVVLFKL
jgi:hypothetical protein